MTFRPCPAARLARRLFLSAVLALVCAPSLPGLGAAPALAQPASGPPNALQGFSQNRDKPVQIDSASLEVRDKEKMATFAGNVHLVQGDVTLKCNSLVVFYENDPDKSAKSAGGGGKPAGGMQTTSVPGGAAGPGGNSAQQIKRIEARGNVVVTQKDQTAIGDNGVFDMKANTVTLIGNVVISQGHNAVKGDRLVVDMTTGVSRVECGKGGNCRVRAVLQPGSQNGSDGPGSGSSAGGREPPRRQSGPSGLY
ncbi:hypothetical protein A33M_0579 [Rhodovulum sp. PH10]|uniref:LptA/OstA family protein n=1 Tax=Rhodovulum sp. PH10 TaxID=1187851 RepID=UPI00027C24A1|nr:LptA/OstA family protein [Rhodovulum sp. PH10]EJW13087.1 hypothetical protein A33M_0579 [Rhodovulum sp. PH10]